MPILDTVHVTRPLVNDDGAVFGAYGFDLEDGTRYLVHADAVILAAGGHNRNTMTAHAGASSGRPPPA